MKEWPVWLIIVGIIVLAFLIAFFWAIFVNSTAII